jgi:hypothetical protein
MLNEWVATFVTYAVWAICKFNSYTTFIKTYTVGGEGVVVVGGGGVVVGVGAAVCI